MDSLTQIVLGAAVGEAYLGKKVGNKAMLWGAIAGTIPDLDVISRYFLNTLSAVEFHRGITHSLLFCIFFSPILGFLIRKLYKKKEASVKDWSVFFFLCLVTHPLLDAHTTWGTQFFWPLDIRLAYKNIFVIDPLYTLPFLVCLLLALRFHRTHQKRRFFNRLGLIISSVYMLITVGLKLYVNKVFQSTLSDQNIKFHRYSTKPTAFNSLLWTANVETSNSFLIGYYSVFDKDKQVAFQEYPKNHHLGNAVEHMEDFKRLKGISENWYTLTEEKGVLYFNDLRFGTLSIAPNVPTEFAFSYILTPKANGLEVEEKPKEFSKGGELVSALMKRILGKEVP